MARKKGIIAICGGIGSGKSVVSRILTVMGYPVYDCDSRAKLIMDNSLSIHENLCRMIHPGAVSGGKIDRHLIAEIVFTDKEKLSRLNQIVHSAVKADLMNWCESCEKEGHGLKFVETAILFESGLDVMVDDVWVVDAPESVRIERVVLRSGLTVEQIKARMVSQQTERFDSLPHHAIENAPDKAILPRIHQLLED